jgi:hypothetical protein
MEEPNNIPKFPRLFPSFLVMQRIDLKKEPFGKTWTLKHLILTCH